MNYRDAVANHSNEVEENNFLKGSLRVLFYLGFGFAVLYLYSWLIVVSN